MNKKPFSFILANLSKANTLTFRTKVSEKRGSIGIKIHYSFVGIGIGIGWMATIRMDTTLSLSSG